MADLEQENTSGFPTVLLVQWACSDQTALNPSFWLSTIQSWWIKAQEPNIWKPFILDACRLWLSHTIPNTHWLHIYTQYKVKMLEAFLNQSTGGTSEMGENDQSIIITREEQRWQRKKAPTLSQRCRDNKIRLCVIHLSPWHSAPQPPTTLSVPVALAFTSLFMFKTRYSSTITILFDIQ